MPKRHRVPSQAPAGLRPHARADQLRPGGFTTALDRPPPGYPGYRPAGPDPIALAEAADRRHETRGNLLGLLAAAGVVALAVEGWLLPLLGGACLAAPVIGLALGLRDLTTARA